MAKKFDVPPMNELFGKISEKKAGLPRPPIQAVQPIDEDPAKSIPVKPDEQQNSQTAILAKGPGGRPSVKKDSVEYVKISPRVPKLLKKRVDIAIINEQFQDANGQPIKTLDEFVSHALERLLK